MQEGNSHNIISGSSDWITDYEWLGIVYPQDSKYAAALITPLAYYDYYDNKWYTFLKADCEQFFPNNGKVVYFYNEAEPLDVYRLYQFCPKRNQHVSSQDNLNYSHYLVFNVSASQPLGQILNWTHTLPTIFDLPAFLEQGISTASCFSRIIYIHYGEHLYGPIHLEADGNLLKAREYLPATHSGGNPLILQKYLFSKQILFEIDHQQFVDPAHMVSLLGKIDCSLPQVTVKAALKAYKNLKNRAAAVQLVDKTIKELVSLHSSTNPEAPVIDSWTLERALYIVKSQMKMITNLQNLLKDLPDDHPLLLAARDCVTQHQKREIEQELQRHKDAMDLELEKRKSEIEQELQQLKVSTGLDTAKKAYEDAQNRLALLLKSVAAAEQKRDTARAELDGLLQEIDQAKADFKKRQNDFKSFELYMEARLEELRQEPLHVLADLHISSALQRVALALFAQDHTIAPIVEETAVQKTLVDAHSVVDQPTVGKQSLGIVSQPNFFRECTFTAPSAFNFLATAAKEYGVPSTSAKINAASLLAGLIPAIYGPVAMPVLQAVAQTIAGNRLWSVPVPLTALSPLDLLGTIVGEERQFIPAGDLADIILEAQSHPQQLGIVLLEGVDRVPFLPVIAPFIQQYRFVRQQKQQAKNADVLPLRLFHSRAIASDDPYQTLARFCWPANLLLAVTLDQAPENFVLPQAYEAWFMYPEVIEAKESSIQKRTIHQIDANDWYTFEKDNFQRGRKFSDTELPDLMLWQKVFVTAAIEMKLPKDSLPTVIEQLWPDLSDDESEQ